MIASLVLALVLLAQVTPSASPSSPPATGTPSPSATPTASQTPAPTQRPPATPAPHALFVVPKGWVQLAPSNPGKNWRTIGRWARSTASAVHSVSVIEGPNLGLGAADVARLNVQTLLRDNPHLRLTADRAFALCGNARGWIIAYPSRKLEYTQVFGVTSTHSYIATYVHPRNVGNDPAGVAAVKSLCPGTDVIAVQNLGPAPIKAPLGWTQNNITGFIAEHTDLPPTWAWYSPPQNGRTHVLMVTAVKTPRAGNVTNDQFFQGVIGGISKWATNVQVIERHSVHLCRERGISARLYAIVKERPEEIDVVASSSTPTSYAVMYMRPLGSPSAPHARQALLSLCPT